MNNLQINSFSGDFDFLSNFYPCSIVHDGLLYPSVEHFYVAMKSNSEQIIDNITYSNIEFRKLVISKTASSAKRLGRKISIRNDWDNIKDNIMYFALNEKFKDKSLLEKLKITEGYELIEGNYWHDNYWGSCYCERCGSDGKNKLGKLLMSIRDYKIGIF
jgi:ribA/ribD-fused uncharacterized protein